jgi:hypothetical protein
LAILCHGLLLTTDYKIWDGWLVENWQKNTLFDVMWRHYSEVGVQHHYFVHRIFGISNHSVWLYKFFSLLCYYGISCGFLLLTTRTQLLKLNEALMGAFLILTFPGMLTMGEAAVFPYVLGLFCFFAAAVCAVESEFRQGAAFWALHGLAVLLFLLSFTYYALLVYYLAFIFIYLWFLKEKYAVDSLNQAFRVLLVRCIYFTLPVAFWMFKTRFMDSFGFYSTYNRPEFVTEKFFAGYRSLLTGTAAHHLTNPCFSLYALIALGVLGWVSAGRFHASSWSTSSRNRLLILCGAGVFLLLLGGLPFILVGRTFEPFGYSTNYSLLVPIAIGLIFSSLISFIYSFPIFKKFGWLAQIPFYWILLASLGIWNRNYLHWQALGAKEASVASKLRADPTTRNYALFLQRDEFRIPLTNVYPTAITSTALQSVFGERRQLALEIQLPSAENAPGGAASAGEMPRVFSIQPLGSAMLDRIAQETTLPYFFSQIDHAGPQALLVIRPGKGASNPRQIGWEYLGHKLWSGISGEGMKRFLEGLTEVQVYPLPVLPGSGPRFRYLPAIHSPSGLVPLAAGE